MTRDAFLNAVLGKPWLANAKGPDAFDCWHLCVYAHNALFGRELPEVRIPANPSWAWMIAAFDQHPERANWREIKSDGMGIVRAGDGAIALMGRYDRPAHSGLWLSPENRMLHADPRAGVCFEPLAALRMAGWTRLRFFEPINKGVTA